MFKRKRKKKHQSKKQSIRDEHVSPEEKGRRSLAAYKNRVKFHQRRSRLQT